MLGTAAVLVLLSAGLLYSPGVSGTPGKSRTVRPAVLRWSVIIAAITLLLYRNVYMAEWMNRNDWEWLAAANDYWRIWTQLNPRELLLKWGNLFSEEVYTREISVFSLLLDRIVWRENLAGYHLSNVIIHATNSFLVAALVFKILRRRSFAFVAGLFAAVYPAASISVCVINGRGDLVACFFILLSLIAYVTSIQKKKSRIAGPAAYLLSLVFGILAMWSKEMAISLPAIVILVEILYRRPSDPFRSLIQVIPFCALTVLKLHTLSGIPEDGLSHHVLRRQIADFLVYFPYNTLLPFIPNERVMKTVFWVYPVLAASLFLAGGKTGERVRLAILGVAFSVCFMIPVYNFVLPEAMGLLRIYYLAAVGASILLAAALTPLREDRKSAWIPIVCVWLFLFHVSSVFLESDTPGSDHSIPLRDEISKIEEKTTGKDKVIFVGDSIDAVLAEFFLDCLGISRTEGCDFFATRQVRRGEEMSLRTLARYPGSELGRLSQLPNGFFEDASILWWSQKKQEFLDAGPAFLSLVGLQEKIPDIPDGHADGMAETGRWELNDRVAMLEPYKEYLGGEFPYRVFVSPPGVFPPMTKLDLEWSVRFNHPPEFREIPCILDFVIHPSDFPGPMDFFLFDLEETDTGSMEVSHRKSLEDYLSGNNIFFSAPSNIRIWLPVAEDVVSCSFVLRKIKKRYWGEAEQ